MGFAIPVPVLLALALAVPAIRIVRGVQARLGPGKIAADALRGAYLVPLFLAISRPSSSAGTWALFVAAFTLMVWDMWIDVRDWRRSKAKERTPTG